MEGTLCWKICGGNRSVYSLWVKQGLTSKELPWPELHGKNGLWEMNTETFHKKGGRIRKS
jgi:hypothetical protein